MFTSQQASIRRQRTGHGEAVFELQLKWSNKYCSYDQIVSEKVVGKGIMCKDIIKYLGLVLK